MDTDPMETSSSPSSPPTPPRSSTSPSLPLLLPPPQTELPLLPSFVGNLDSATRASVRQHKWTLVLLLPRVTPAVTSRPHPAWGADAFHAARKIHAPREIVDNVLLWRRMGASADAERYTAFFPTDGLPHLALLDPRSGERLAVWGNDGLGMEDDALADSLWESVVDDLKEFLKHHSLINGALGPAHHREKTWAVRTRRVSERRDPLPPTSVMDDEDAAIAAAIAASLKEAEGRDSDFDSGSDDDHEHDDDDTDDIFNDDVSSQEDDDGNDSKTVSDDFEQRDESGASSPQGVPVRMSSRLDNIPAPSQRPVLIPSRGGYPLPSSVESLSSSYLERMESCFRSSTNSQLMETRRLRQEQDAELAASLHEDRLREEQERLEAERKAAKKKLMLEALARLPDEPAEGSQCLTIAIRLSAGKRITRRFNSFDTLQSIADFAIADSGCVSLAERMPGTALRIAGIKLAGRGWNTPLCELQLSSRTMVMLND